jgi:hypothetical protein
MKNLTSIVFTLIAMTGTNCLMASSAQAGLCDDPIRDQATCLRMKHLKSSINLLDAQRDLLQVNYPFLASIADDMKSVANEILKDSQNGHLAAIENISSLASRMGQEARVGNTHALVSSNQFKSQCMTCHSNATPSSGYKWEEISGMGWDDIVKKCNQPDHLPYVCKNMHGMASSYNYFMTAWDSKVRSFESTEKVADEIIRVSNDLLAKGMTHNAPGTLESLQKEAMEIKRMSVARDPGAFERSRLMVQSCSSCHGSAAHRASLR